MEKLASLKPLHPEIEGFSITAGNAGGVNDAAAAMVVADRAFAERPRASSRWPPSGRGRRSASPRPTPAWPRPSPSPRRSTVPASSVGDVALWEINEAFASVPRRGRPRARHRRGARQRPRVSGCSLGHPIAATGARMVITLTHELRRRGGGIAVAAMCAGGGMAQAVVLEVPA